MDRKSIIRYFNGHNKTYIGLESENDYMFLMELFNLLRYKIDNNGELLPPIEKRDGKKYCLNPPSRFIWVNSENGTIVFIPLGYIPKLYWSSSFFCFPLANEND